MAQRSWLKHYAFKRIIVKSRALYPHPEVYHGVDVTRTNIEIDDQLVDRAMRLYRLSSKREAVNLALRRLVGDPMSREEALAMEGKGWAGDLAEIRSPEENPSR
ncbi:MAG TPA: type II toxin-antitoxin system VapB family antitoxin [Solirubrobacterales bacterium]|jgi:Arc/MetJ family transcription regulator|nr:type II toxin-antitoxin system VapB family antitoxin [Solirubrobacterales bacterium]